MAEGTFIVTRGGEVTIDDFSYPLKEFLLDEPTFHLPPGEGVTYIRGRKFHAVTDKGSESRAEGARIEWPEGEAFIAKKDQYKAAYFTRHPEEAPVDPTKPPPDPPIDPRLSDLRKALDDAISSVVIGPGSVRAVFEAWRKLL